MPQATVEVDSGESHPSTYSPIQTRTTLPPPASASVPSSDFDSVFLSVDSAETLASLSNSADILSHNSSEIKETTEDASGRDLSSSPAAAQGKPSENIALIVVSVILMLAFSVIFAFLVYIEYGRLEKLEKSEEGQKVNQAYEK
jgi:hypothetical protein